MILETGRLLLREMDFFDRPAIAAILQDRQAMYAYEHAFSDKEVNAWIAQQLQRYAEYGFGLWAVADRSSGTVIGQCGITMQSCPDRLVPEVGYLFRRSAWGHGYATEAAIACRDYAFHRLGLPEVFSLIRDNNYPSQRVALRNGMSLRGRFVKHYYGMDLTHLIFSVRRPGALGACAL